MKLDTTILVYKAKDGHRWRMRAPNGRIIAESGEAYTRRGRAFKAATNLVDTITQGGVVVVAEWAKP